MRRVVAIVPYEADSQPVDRETLARLAEIALGYGPRVGIALGDPALPLDTVYLDLTGCAHLHGGEEATLAELSSRARKIGHPARLAIAEGPRMARAIARFSREEITVIAEGEGRRALAKLPLAALVLEGGTEAFFENVGLLTLGDLARLPPSTLSSRLGRRARDALELLAGRDAVPILAYEPPRVPVEGVAWEEGVGSLEALLFASRGLIARLSARLEGRGEATRAIELRARYDASIAKLRGVKDAELSARIELPAAIFREGDIFRVLKAKLETLTLEAPVETLHIAATHLTRAPHVQLDLSRDAHASPDALPTLLAELSAELGPACFGVLSLVPTHRPEARAELVPPSLASRSSGLSLLPQDAEMPTRLLLRPATLPGALALGEVIELGPLSFAIHSLRRRMRLDRVEWWSESPLSRDYACISLVTGKMHIEAWVYRDRATGERCLQGYFD